LSDTVKATVSDKSCYRTLSKPRCPTNPVIGHCQIYGVRQILLSDTVKTAVSDKYCYRTLSKLRCPTNTVIGHCQIYGVRQILLSDTVNNRGVRQIPLSDIVKSTVSDKSRYRTLSKLRCTTNTVIGHCQIYGVRQIPLSDTVKATVSDKSRYRTLSKPRCPTNPINILSVKIIFIFTGILLFFHRFSKIIVLKYIIT
jgi:hypothetical protein